MTTKIPLYYWKPDTGDNFGDKLSHLVVSKLTDGQISVTNNLFYPHKKLLGVGSLLQLAKNDDILWGTGMRSKVHPHNFTRLDVRAVRGPLTCNFLLSKGIECPNIFGDPALALPHLFPEWKVRNEGKIGFMPHLSQMDHYKNIMSGVEVISPHDPYDQVMQKMLGCKYMISSSLHGLIVSHAYDIPCYWLYEQELDEGKLKFCDYLLSQGMTLEPVKSVDEALRSNLPPTSVNKINVEDLLDAFPHDKINPGNRYYPRI